MGNNSFYFTVACDGVKLFNRAEPIIKTIFGLLVQNAFVIFVYMLFYLSVNQTNIPHKRLVQSL